MIKNVIFDIGGVLLDFKPYEYTMRFDYDLETKKKLYSVIFEDKRWIELDRGTLSNETYLSLLVKENPDYVSQITEVFKDWITMLTPIDKTIEFYKKLKEKGYKIYLLSNFSSPAYEITEQLCPFLKMADGKIISYSVKTVKPEKQIYDILLSKYNLIPRESIFIDDRQENVDAAKALGINGIHFETIDKVIKKFNDLVNSL